MLNRSLYMAGCAAVIAAVLLMTACGDRKGAGGSPSPSASPSPPASAVAPSESPSATPSASAGNKLLDDFVQQASTDVLADKLMGELGRAMTGASASDADEMLRAMDGYYTRNLPEMEKKFQAEKAQSELSKLRWPVTKEQIDAIKDEEVRALINQAQDGGYKLETSEGFVFPVVDYAELRGLAEGASPAMKDYLSIMAAESENKTQSDAAFIISRDELVNRMAASEAYAKNYPNTPEYDKVVKWYVTYLTFDLVGLDNTANYDDSYHITPQIKAHFEKTVLEHPGTVTAKLTAELLQILDQTKGAFFDKAKDGMQVDIPEMKAFRDGIESKAKEALKAQ